jgi:hypothetical protein
MKFKAFLRPLNEKTLYLRPKTKMLFLRSRGTLGADDL